MYSTYIDSKNKSWFSLCMKLQVLLKTELKNLCIYDRKSMSVFLLWKQMKCSKAVGNTRKKLFKTNHFYKTLYYSIFPTVIRSKNPRHIHVETLFAVGQHFSSSFCYIWTGLPHMDNLQRKIYLFMCMCKARFT